MSDVLTVEDYTLRYRTGGTPVTALSDVSLSIQAGTTLGLVGESGSGKSSLAWAIMRYLPQNAVEGDGTLKLSGEDLRQKSHREVLAMRGRDIAMVFQDPSTSLNPTMRLGDQLAEVLTRHRDLTERAAKQEGEALLERTGIAHPADMMERYPHEASGGEKQRVVIATALACQPKLIIFDEPTTALDIITARQILDLFDKLRSETEVTALYISHDLGLVSRVADHVAVIHEGRIVENGATEDIFTAPQDAYTVSLMNALPRPDERLSGPAPAADTPRLAVQDVTVRYGGSSALLRRLGLGKPPFVGADDISLTVGDGEFLGVVGESGSGKSTIAKALVGLLDFDGDVAFAGRTLTGRTSLDRTYRRSVQIIFQHPDASLNPRQSVGEILSRPLRLYDLATGSAIPQRVEELLETVQLPADFAKRYPHQLSGGQKQRVAIARAFAAEPQVVVCDEITSSLDVSVQAAVARLLVALQAKAGTSCIFITHDINLVRQLAHRLVVMQRGKIVDVFPVAEAEASTRHPYTKALLEAVPVAPRVAAPRALTGESA